MDGGEGIIFYGWIQNDQEFHIIKITLGLDFVFYILFFYLGGGCQAVRDRTAQTGAPILKMLSIYTDGKLWLAEMLDQMTLNKTKTF